MADTSHNFAVGVVQLAGKGAIFCSGVLLAPNLVATARHCVSQLASPQIDCSASSPSTFGGTQPAADVLVTPTPTITHGSSYSGVASILVPAELGVCGNDIALLILSQSIPLPDYAIPSINPPMTDHHAYSTSVTAIGYGVDTPTDTTGSSAGTRRIRENIQLGCIPNDKTFTDCFRYQNAQQFITAKEFEGGDGTCEGDSGSAAFDQGNFDNGKWVAFGVLSRGGSGTDGGTCLVSIYTRFDAWAQFLIDGANQAAMMGGYSPPSWATSSSSQPGVDASSPSSSGGGACLANHNACNVDGDCCSVNCLSYDNGQTFLCASCDANNPCNKGYGCQNGVCVAGALSSTPSPPLDGGSADAGTAAVRLRSGGCSLGSAAPLPWEGGAAALGCAALVLTRRRGAKRLV
jgi:secreted trypsin-like serine protease